MNSLPDFDTMSTEEKIDWVAKNDISPLLATMKPAPARIALPDSTVEAAIDGTPMRVRSVRLPDAMCQELAHFAHRDRDGMSGLIRIAVARLLPELRELERRELHGEAA